MNSFIASMRSAIGQRRWPLTVPPAVFVAFVAAILMLAGNAVIVDRNTRAMVLADSWVSHTLEVLERLRAVGNRVLLAESAERGFLLSGKDEYLAPYANTREQCDVIMDSISGGVIDNPDQMERLGALRVLVHAKFDEMDKTIKAYRESGPAQASEIVDRGDSLRYMERIRAVLLDMVTTEQKLLEHRRSGSQRTISIAYVSLYTSTIVVVGLLLAFYILIHRYIQTRHRVEDELAASRDGLERRVRERTAQLSELSQHLFTVREDEKRSIARELHDEFGSNLTAVSMDISWAREKLEDQAPEVTKRLDRAVSVLNDTVELKRRIISGLRPSTLDTLGLEVALEGFLGDYLQRTGIDVELDIEGDFSEVDEKVSIAIYRIVQEALTNVARHAKASAARVSLHRSDEDIVLEISDNGVGLAKGASAKPKSHGLLGMRERAIAMGGKLDVLPNPGGGTRVVAVISTSSTTDFAAGELAESLP